MRKSPIRHTVSGYNTEDGTHVKPYVRGKYLPPGMGKPPRSIPKYFEEFRSLPPEERIDRYAMRLFHHDTAWLPDHHIVQMIEYQLMRNEAGQKLWQENYHYIYNELLRSLEKQGLIKRRYDKAFITKRGMKFREADYNWNMAIENEPYRCIDCGKKIEEIDVKHGGHRCAKCDMKRFNKAVSGGN